MKKAAHRVSGIIIAFITVICLLFGIGGAKEINALIVPTIGKTSRYSLNIGDEYAFINGASINRNELTETSGSLKFCFQIKDPTLDDLRDELGLDRTYWGGLSSARYIYTFTVYRYKGVLGDDTNFIDASPIKSVRIMFSFNNYTVKKHYGSNGQFEISEETPYPLQMYYGERIYVRDVEDIRLLPDPLFRDNIFLNDALMEGLDCVNTGFDKYMEGFNIKYRIGIKEGFGLRSDNGNLDVVLSNISNYQKYFVRCTVEQDKCVDGGNMFGVGYREDTTKRSCDSPVRSIVDVLTNMRGAGMLSEEMRDKYEIACSILDDGGVNRVKVRLLEQIGDTPFAHPVYEFVDVPVIDNKISVIDLCSAFGVDTLDCLGSIAYGTTYDPSLDVYNVYYTERVWVRAITIDGNYYDYFLNINSSYRDSYYPFVGSGILESQRYEWVFTTLLITFPELAEFQPDEIFGYFGFMILPVANTLNKAYVDLFGATKNLNGVMKSISYTGNLTSSQMDSLMEDYNYPHITRAWEGLFGEITSHKADYYVVYVEPGVDSGFIGEGGQDDIDNTNSAISNQVVKPLAEKIGALFSDINFLKWVIVGALGLTAIIIVIKVIQRRR